MQKLSLILLLALCVASHGYGYEGRYLMQHGSSSRGSSRSSSSSGGASASVSVSSQGGSSRGAASSTGKAFSDAKSAFIVFCERVFNQVKFLEYKGGPRGRYCVSAYSLIDEYVEAYGKASANAFASTSATIEVQGRGSGCAGSNAYARSQAEAYATIIAQGIAEARIGRFSAKASASGNIVSNILVQAFAKSYSKACRNKAGFTSAYQTTHAEAIGVPIATLWIWLYADVDCRNEKEFVDVVAEGESKVKTTTSVTTSDGVSSDDGGFGDAGGDGIATATQHCRNFENLGLHNCCSLRSGIPRCNCLKGRSFGPRTRCNAVREKDVKNVWFDWKSQTSCHC